MRRSALNAAILKELRLLARDPQGLALLFLLPLAFILIMSTALQSMFEGRAGGGLGVLVADMDRSVESAAFYERLSEKDAFDIAPFEGGEGAVLSAMKASDASFGVIVPVGYGYDLVEPPEERSAPPVRVVVASSTDKRTEMIFLAALRETLGRQRVDAMLQDMAEAAGAGDAAGGLDTELLQTELEVDYAYAGGAAPTAVQQNVPAWLVFAVFFISIPFSTTFIRERELGAAGRLATMPVGAGTRIGGKFIPYFLVNQAQVAAMLAVGVFVMPLLAADALQMNGSPYALAALSASLSLAALGLAVLIAVLARTVEQATMLSGLGNIILAAIGGIMVPKFVMPEGMQRVAALSPMEWGLDGFHEILLRGGGLSDISADLIKLSGFGAAALLLAWSFNRRGA